MRDFLQPGARRVLNRFVNSCDGQNPEDNPWWGEAILIYPAVDDWPDGVIDLRGGGY
ncbi:MAG: hypothetical protein ACFE0O_12675 [Opitutales bacterium]